MLLTRASQEAQPVSGSPATQETRVQSLGRDDPLGVGTGNPLQYSLPENPMDTGAWRAAVRGVLKESDVTEEDLAHRRYTEHFSQLKKKKRLDMC